jgi:DNA-binding CsgD family transcriptional regulator
MLARSAGSVVLRAGDFRITRSGDACRTFVRYPLAGMSTGGRPRSAGDEVEAVLGAAAESSTLNDIGERALPPLRRAIGASSALLYRYEDAGRIAPIAGEIAGIIDHYARDYFHLDPVQRFPRSLAPQPRVVFATRHVEPRTYRRSAAYGEFYAAFEMEHLVCAWLTHLPYGSPGMTGLLFARPPDRGDFGDAEQRVLMRVLPSLTAAAARAERLRDLSAERDALHALVQSSAPRARLVVSADGKVVWASAECEALLQARARVSLEVLRNAARRLHDVRQGTFAASPTVTMTTATGPIQAHLSPLRTSAGAPLVLVELESGDAARSWAARFGLTPAETTVLDLLAEGLSNRSIAARLHVSIETVRTHVRRVLGKLGVGSRVEAALLVARAR